MVVPGANSPPNPSPVRKRKRQEHPVALRQGAQAGKCSIGHDGQHERSAPSEIVGEHPTGHSTGGPSEQGHRREAAEIERELGELVRRDEIADGDGADEKQRVRLVAVEEPAQSRGQQCAPGGRGGLGRESATRRRIAGDCAGRARHRFRLGMCQIIGHRLRRCVGSLDVHKGVTHLHSERAEQVAAACAVAGFARLLQRGSRGGNAGCADRLRGALELVRGRGQSGEVASARGGIDLALGIDRRLTEFSSSEVDGGAVVAEPTRKHCAVDRRRAGCLSSVAPPALLSPRIGSQRSSVVRNRSMLTGLTR